MQNNYPVISCINRIPADPINGGKIAGILISNNSTNYFNVVGNNLDQIIDVRWSPANPATIKFNVIPYVAYPGSVNLARFGIVILDNFFNAENRGGYLSFRRLDNTMIQWPVVTYGSLNLTWNGPYSGLREFET
jgi:hypothetical protein